MTRAIETDLVVEQVTDRVARIELPLPFEDLHVVNAYAILGDDSVTLVDPGWSEPGSEGVLLRALEGLGRDRSQVRQVLATHSHPDHYTLAVQWQQEHGIPVLLGEGERPTVEAWDTLPGRFPEQARRLLRAGAPELAVIVRAMPLEPFEEVMAFGPPSGWLEDGQVIDCDGVDLVAVATPGHTAGHVVFEEPGGRLLLTGDHVLPRITPSTGHEMVPEQRPLASYLPSLQLLADRPDTRMLPAHGQVTASVRERAEELLRHHDERFLAICARVQAGDSTAHEIARALPWTRHERRLSDLDVLETRGTLRSTEERGVSRFEI